VGGEAEKQKSLLWRRTWPSTCKVLHVSVEGNKVHLLKRFFDEK
jgi:hypothetical protein